MSNTYRGSATVGAGSTLGVPASSITNAPAGNIAATTMQTAINELDTEKLALAGGAMTGAITTSSTFDGRDVATDGTKLDNVEALADVTDSTNVLASLVGQTVAADNFTFPATQVASADANNLDDYEEGAWTPSVGGDATYNAANAGRYIKIGRSVTCYCYLRINILGTGSTSRISGLPFTNGAMQGSGAISLYSSLAVSPINMAAYLGSGGTGLDMYGNTTAGASAVLLAAFGNSARVHVTITYEV